MVRTKVSNRSVTPPPPFSGNPPDHSRKMLMCQHLSCPQQRKKYRPPLTVFRRRRTAPFWPGIYASHKPWTNSPIWPLTKSIRSVLALWPAPGTQTRGYPLRRAHSLLYRLGGTCPVPLAAQQQDRAGNGIRLPSLNRLSEDAVAMIRQSAVFPLIVLAHHLGHQFLAVFRHGAPCGTQRSSHLQGIDKYIPLVCFKSASSSPV